MKKKRIALLLLVLKSFVFSFNAYSQDCENALDFNFKASAAGRGINWEQFPSFSLPFKIIYGGPAQYANAALLFERGITHFSNPISFQNLPINKRAYIQYNVASATPSQPIQTDRSPWSNDFTVLEKWWREQINNLKISTGSTNTANLDIFITDIERQWKSDFEILQIRNLASTPANIKSLSDKDFILAYKKDIQVFYARAINFYINNTKIDPQNTAISSYTDSPILNTFINLQGRNWSDWQKDPAAINFITYDFEKKSVGGDFYKALNFLTPSSYFYYDYPHPFAGEYLSYLLFQVEANRAWSTKDQILFLWQRFSFNADVVGKPIRSWMAEASTIFPFFAGAKGLWIWEDPQSVKDTENLSNYEYYMLGLYRLSKFKSMFEGDYERVEAISARDYNENKQAIWRGIVKDGEILIAAHNPWAKDASEEKEITVSYKNWNKKIVLKGYETHLCKYKLENISALDFYDLVIYPNPNDGQLNFKVQALSSQKISLRIFEISGKLLKEYLDYPISKGFSNHIIDVSDLKNNPEIIVELGTSSQRLSKKVILK